MCGGDLELLPDSSIATCEFCGSVQTVPKADDEKKLTLFARANRLRAACEFDKASGIYETIVAEFPEEAEAYWGIVLCKYGIEYVDDPATGKRIPTCHRSSFDSIMEDSDFEQALENADSAARKLYREEAKQIEELRKGIVAVSSREAPYDIFICYKKTDEKGDPTLDSALAQDIYDALTDKGYRVFFAQITLEDKLGREYEPCIFAALHSARIMLAVGTDYEYYNAVWVKNEWSRFLKLMAKNKDKYLIPCFKGIDAYDMPKEFNKLQAQDLGKVGAIQDLLRGIGKIIAPPNSGPVAAVSGGSQPETEKLLNNARIHLQEKSWKSVRSTCEQIIAQDPGEPWAYVYQLMRMRRVTQPEQLADTPIILSDSKYYQSALKYADPELKEKLERWNHSSVEASRRAEERCAEGIRRAQKVRGLIAGGQHHTAAVLTDGTVVARGRNDQGQCNVEYWRDVIAVACGNSNTLGLKADGTVVACGDNSCGQCDVEQWRDIVAIACSKQSSAGLRKDGTVVFCGDGASGWGGCAQWTDVTMIASGFDHLLALKSDGTCLCLGSTGSGRCDVEDWKNIVSVYACNQQSIGLRKNGTIAATGCTEDSRLVTWFWDDIIDIGAGTHHTVGLRCDGTVRACGDDGQGRRTGCKSWTNVVGLARTFWNTFGICRDGTVVSCGDDDDSKRNLGDIRLFYDLDNLEQERLEAREHRKKLDEEQAREDRKYRQRREQVRTVLAGGQKHVVALSRIGKVWAFGDNSMKQCNVGAWSQIAAVDCGLEFTVGLTEGGTAVACGNNEHGQCNVTGWNNLKQIACGDDHTVALKQDGTVVACGRNDNRQCDVECWRNIVAVRCGRHHTLGLKADGTVVSAGSNEYHQRDVAGWNGIVGISAGGLHSLGLRRNGTVVLCGEVDDGMTEDDLKKIEGWSDVIALASGSHHILALKKDGTVYAMGYDGASRCSGVEQWSSIAGIVCGTWFSVGLTAEGVCSICGELDGGVSVPLKWHLKNYRLFCDVDELEAERQQIKDNRKWMSVYKKNLKKRIVAEHSVLAPDGQVIRFGEAEAPCKNMEDIVCLAGGMDTIIGLRKNGTVFYHGGTFHKTVENWYDIVSVEQHHCYVAGLKADGTVVTGGVYEGSAADTKNWTNITDIRCHDNIVIGLRSDGTVRATGNNEYKQCNVSGWSDISDVAIGSSYVIGLRRNGTVVFSGLDIYGLGNVTGWKGITAIAAGWTHCVGLCTDGTVVACGENNEGQCDVQGWRNMIDVVCGGSYTVGLRADGMVLVATKKDCTLKRLNGLSGAVALCTAGAYVFILMQDGSVIRASYYGDPEEKAIKAKVFRSLEELRQDLVVVLPKDPQEVQNIRQQIENRMAQRRSSGVCQHCGSEFKGLLTKKCTGCDMKKDY